jgi:hypothetical protein
MPQGVGQALEIDLNNKNADKLRKPSTPTSPPPGRRAAKPQKADDARATAQRGLYNPKIIRR